MMIKKVLLTLVLFSLTQLSFAQVFLSNNASISITDKALLSVRGDIINRSNGFIYNTDTIDLIGNWQNDNAQHAMDSTYAGIVRFTGADQRLEGLYETYFYHVSLENSGIKSASIDQRNYGKLLLNDRELAMNPYTFWVKNPSIDAVTNTTGFVSSTDDGGIQRNMNQTGSYLFPVGSNAGSTLYRPIYIHTKNNLFQQYKIGLTPRDATLDAFDRDIKERFICTINPLYYHRLYKNTNTDAVDIDFWYEPIDGNYNTVAHWDNTAIWQKPDTAIQNLVGAYWVTQIRDWSDFDEKAFALAYVSAPFGLAGNDTSIYLGASIQLQTESSINAVWSPDYNITCTACDNPVATPDTSTTYYVVTERKDGCKNIDTIHIEVIPSLDQVDLFIPNLITPNGDGSNDNWIIRALEQFPDNEVVVLNRWGDQLFVKKPYDNSFNGTLWGKELPEGTYYYLVKIHVLDESKTFDGPLTIIR